MVPGPYQAKKYCHTPNVLTTISRVPTKQHIILPDTKYLHLTRVYGGAPISFLIQIKLKNSATPNFLTTISRDPTKQHIILPYTKYLHLTRV